MSSCKLVFLVFYIIHWENNYLLVNWFFFLVTRVTELLKAFLIQSSMTSIISLENSFSFKWIKNGRKTVYFNWKTKIKKKDK